MTLTEAERAVVSEAVLALDDIDVSDPEEDHIKADDILLKLFADLGLAEVSDAYERVVEREGSWWFA